MTFCPIPSGTAKAKNVPTLERTAKSLGNRWVAKALCSTVLVLDCAENNGAALTASTADTDCANGSSSGFSQLACQCSNNSCAGCPDGVAQSDRTAPLVHNAYVNTEVLGGLQRNDAKASLISRAVSSLAFTLAFCKAA